MSKHKAKPPIPQKSAAVVERASVNAACHHLANIANCPTRSTRMSDNSASLIKQRISLFEGKDSNSKQVPEPVTIRKKVACCSDVRRPRTVNAAAKSDVAILSAAKASSKRQSVAMLSESKIFHQRYSVFETNIGSKSQVDLLIQFKVEKH